MHPYFSHIFGLARGEETRLWRRNQAAIAEMKCIHKPHAFCNKCVHTSSKPNFQEAYLLECSAKVNDLGLVGKLRMSIF